MGGLGRTAGCFKPLVEVHALRARLAQLCIRSLAAPRCHAAASASSAGNTAGWGLVFIVVGGRRG